MWWRRQCKIPSARSTECTPSTKTLLQTLWRMSWGLELLLHLLSYLQQERKSYYCCSPSTLHKAQSLGTAVPTQGCSANLYYAKSWFHIPWVQDGWQITIGRELLGSVQQSFDKKYVVFSIFHIPEFMGKLQVGQGMATHINSHSTLQLQSHAHTVTSHAACITPAKLLNSISVSSLFYPAIQC